MLSPRSKQSEKDQTCQQDWWDGWWRWWRWWVIRWMIDRLLPGGYVHVMLLHIVSQTEGVSAVRKREVPWKISCCFYSPGG